MNDFDAFGKKYLDEWRQRAAKLPDSTRQEIMRMKKSGMSVQEICSALELPSEEVSITVIEEFAKERGETPVFN